MTASIVSITGGQLDSAVAISALPKEKIRMKAQRYQRGSLRTMKRKSLPDAWYYRYYAEEQGKKVYKRQFVGTVIDLPKRKDAENAVIQLRVNANMGAEYAPMNMQELIAHYKERELQKKAYSTQVGYRKIFEAVIEPKWGKTPLLNIKSVPVEEWLDGMKKKSGGPASPAYGAKVRNLMSALFSHAIRYEYAATNPITPVRTSAKRLRTPDILTANEFKQLLAELPKRERLAVKLAGGTGLRRGELFALRWCDVDLEDGQANVTRSIWHNVVGITKTEASRKPVPLHPILVEELKMWRSESAYQGKEDYLFPSVLKEGKQPVQPEMILRRHIRPALKRIGVKKRIGWHSFRHGFATVLRQNGVDIKTAQELLRHANPRITMGIYQQAVTEEKRVAQEKVLQDLLGEVVQSNHSAPGSAA
jgi:integrase